jgi:Cryptococcal mannosyltransferase 1
MDQQSTNWLLSKSWSQFHDLDDHSDGDDAFSHASRVKPRKRESIKRFIVSLSYQPLGLGRRFRSTNRLWRLLICYINFVFITFAFSFIISLWDALFRPSYTYPPAHYIELENTLKSSSIPGRGNSRNETIFIASNIIQHDLIRGSWSKNLLEIIDYLGPQNVFVSIYENDSGPEAPKALAWLRDQLNCDYSITIGDHIPLSNFPTVVTPNGKLAIKRLTYLTEVRNRMLRPLETPDPAISINYTSTRFDRILFLNDIYYHPPFALNLLFSTNLDPTTNLPDYDVACATDFWNGATLYDSFVLHDTDGFETDWFTYPWFTTRGSSTSRRDVLAQKDAVRVRSCWNGLAAYRAAPFLRADVLQQPEIVHKPLRFRAQSDLFWEASECCLMNADLAAWNPTAKIFLNPYIRVAYEPNTWVWERRLRRIEAGLAVMQWWMSKLRTAYEHNPRRQHIPGTRVTKRAWLFERDDLNGEKMGRTPEQLQRLSKEDLKGGWTNVEGVAEIGGFCGQKRLFVLLPDFEKENQKVAGKSGGENWMRITEPPDWRW